MGSRTQAYPWWKTWKTCRRGTGALRLPITYFAHKAANGELTISCRNRHCPKCQGAAARRWLAEREAELLPVQYFHVVYTLPTEFRGIAHQNKPVIYDLFMKASAETTLAIAADPKHLGARIGIIAVLHTWGSALTHHPHVHMIVPGGGLSGDGSRWVSSRPGFLVHVNVLSRLFRGRFLTMLIKAHTQDRLKFFADHSALADKRTFKRFLAPLRKNGSSTPRTRSPDLSRCCAIFRAIPTASPSPIVVWSRSTTTASPFVGRTIASTAPPAGRQ
jgi:Putative transposase/Transposase zinc-binding domain